ncbi:MAG: hypothetical protein CK538_05240 [Opitutia bacterium]|nr:hypothetical protein [Opitutaceae bacterium]PHX85805.1 MAG: hypothetical protein CK538_05240 [Opitutae bacterium]
MVDGASFGTPVAVVVFGGFSLSKSMGLGIYVMLTGGVIFGLVAAFSLPCFYVVSDAGVRIKCGVFDEDLPLAKIRKIELSWSPLSAPALSLRRAKITLEDGTRLVSPREREAFIADLEARLKIQRVEGDGLSQT